MPININSKIILLLASLNVQDSEYTQWFHFVLDLFLCIVLYIDLGDCGIAFLLY